MNFFLDVGKLEILTARRLSFDQVHFEEVCSKSMADSPLSGEDIAMLLGAFAPEDLGRLFHAANMVKEVHLAKKVRLFVPLYISNECINNCLYCGFRAENTEAVRRTLSMRELMQEVALLYERGHRNLLLVTAENPQKISPSFICDLVCAIKNTYPEITRVNINYPPVGHDDFLLFKNTKIDAYQSFQETYHPVTYKKMHPAGLKSSYSWRLEAFDRACRAGINEFGAGLLWGLHELRFELMAMVSHLNYLRSTYGIVPGTISVPRLRPAEHSPLSMAPPHRVDDATFKKIIAICRLAFPTWDIAVSTRETEEMRRESLFIGASMLSAGSETNPGGYSRSSDITKQFSMEDTRALDEVLKTISELGMIPETGQNSNLNNVRA